MVTGRILTVPSNAPSDTIGFYAIMSKTTDNQCAFHTLIFDSILTDVGNGYHRYTGVFSAPIGGLYAFTWSLRLFGNEYHSAQLMVNNAVYGAVFLDVSGGGNENVSGTRIVFLTTGDNVFIRTDRGKHGSIESNSSGYSSFGGWLIK